MPSSGLILGTGKVDDMVYLFYITLYIGINLTEDSDMEKIVVNLDHGFQGIFWLCKLFCLCQLYKYKSLLDKCGVLSTWQLINMVLNNLGMI